MGDGATQGEAHLQFGDGVEVGREGVGALEACGVDGGHAHVVGDALGRRGGGSGEREM